MITKIYEMVVRIPKMVIITLYLTTSSTTIYQENIGRCHTQRTSQMLKENNLNCTTKRVGRHKLSVFVM